MSPYIRPREVFEESLTELPPQPPRSWSALAEELLYWVIAVTVLTMIVRWMWLT